MDVSEERTMNLIVKNGFVYDPLNGIDGEVMDIAIKNGHVAEDVDEHDAKIIDASGMIVMPGGVDIHAVSYTHLTLPTN